MRDHHEYNKISIGSSDVAALILVGFSSKEKGLKSSILKFGEDNSYRAYIVDGECEIPTHYILEAEFNSWMKIYDDEGLTYDTNADIIRVYRAGGMGVIIQLINGDKNNGE